MSAQPSLFKPRLTDDEKRALVQMLGDNVPRDEIAEAFGISTSGVQYYAAKYGFLERDLTALALDEPTPTRGLREQLRPQPWMDDALCAQTDPESFFPEKGGSNNDAVATCRRCPVAAECLDFALNNNEKFGIWGGVTERTRHRLATTTNTTS